MSVRLMTRHAWTTLPRRLTIATRTSCGAAVGHRRVDLGDHALALADRLVRPVGADACCRIRAIGRPSGVATGIQPNSPPGRPYMPASTCSVPSGPVRSELFAPIYERTGVTEEVSGKPARPHLCPVDGEALQDACGSRGRCPRHASRTASRPARARRRCPPYGRAAEPSARSCSGSPAFQTSIRSLKLSWRQIEWSAPTAKDCGPAFGPWPGGGSCQPTWSARARATTSSGERVSPNRCVPRSTMAGLARGSARTTFRERELEPFAGSSCCAARRSRGACAHGSGARERAH